MKKLTIALMVCLMTMSDGCDFFECKNTEQPDINFEFIVWGHVVVKDYITKNIITVDWNNRELKSPIWKCYCNGKKNGPFTNWYKIGPGGELNYEGIGTWSFKMDNDMDYMYVSFIYEKDDLGDFKVYYSELAPYNNRAANLEVKIEIEWDTVNNKILDSRVTLI